MTWHRHCITACMNHSDHKPDALGGAVPQPLAEFANWLSPRMAAIDPRGYVRGKTQIRDYVCAALGCSELEAEQAVEELMLAGRLEFEGDPTTAGFEPKARWLMRQPDTLVR